MCHSNLTLPPSDQAGRMKYCSLILVVIVVFIVVSYKSSHHASNPPKHRMSGAVARTTNTSHTPFPSNKSPGSGCKGDRGVLRVAGEVGDSRDIRALQPPPTSKQAKAHGTNSSQSQVQSGGTTYFYSGRQVSGGERGVFGNVGSFPSALLCT